MISLSVSAAWWNFFHQNPQIPSLSGAFQPFSFLTTWPHSWQSGKSSGKASRCVPHHSLISGSERSKLPFAPITPLQKLLTSSPDGGLIPSDLLEIPPRHSTPCLLYAVLVVLLRALAWSRRKWVMRTLRRAFCVSRDVFSSRKEQRSRCRRRMLAICLAVALPPILSCLISLRLSCKV